MIPYLVTAPAALPVDLPGLKAHLRVAHDDDDADLAAKLAGVVARLDGWGGLLGRCIMPQVWAVDVQGPGPHILPFPDASAVSAVSGVDDLAVTVARRGLGPAVTVADALPDQAVTISATFGLPATRLPAAQALVKMMVQHEFDGESSPLAGSLAATCDRMIADLRWRRL